MPPRTRATPPRRKQTTARAFLFSDLRDYTSYVEAKGDAAAARLLREYRTLVRREVARHDGAEVKTEGDSFYVVFDSASAALDCAVGVLRAADTRSTKDPTAPLRIGVGLHAGETVEYDDQFVGSAVNIASRLAGKAAAMELLISDTLRGLVRTSQSLPMTDRGALELKGVAEKIRAWSVEWREPERAPSLAPVALPATARQRAAPPTGQLLCPVVVGRRAERERFAAALAAAVGGAGQTVVVGGEAGVGKSAFVREAQDRAAAAGCRVLVGLTLQADAGLPYGPFVSAVRSGFRGLDRDELGRVLRQSAPDLAELFPELGRIERAEAPSSLERHRLAVAFQHLLRAFAREAPLLVVLEDLHWADETSLELLQHLARELRDERALVLATYRSDEMHRRHPFLRVLAELQRERLVTEIALRRLTPDETKELIRETFAASDPDVSVSDEFRDAIYARSEGSPFFTEELLKALVESGGIYFRTDTGWGRKPIAELEIPGSIREAVRTRVDRLSAEARDTLSAASVIGQRFSFDLLRTVRGVDEQVIETHVREFIELQLVIEASDDGGESDEYAFRHALTREVVYDDLLVRERKRLHRAVAAALGEAAEPSLLAHHLLAAGEAERAVPLLLEAARRAFRASAPREAVAHVTRALEVGVPDEDLAPALELQAEAYHFFDAALSLKAAVEAAEAYQERGDPRGRSRMLRLASRSHWLRGEGAEAQSLAREALDMLTGEPESMELGRATAHLAGLRMVDNDDHEAIALADQAIAIGGRTGDPWTIANALISKGSALGRSDGPVGLALIREGTALAQREGLIDAASRGMNNSVLWAMVTGLPRAEVRRSIEAALAWARAHGLE
ncbi:MAG TPA: AAA family ATPase, partial [Candidatus Limnocylindria bacterium]|nr:AAA family ATPase [Candidatus Limnocylindria bacterium]